MNRTLDTTAAVLAALALASLTACGGSSDSEASAAGRTSTPPTSKASSSAAASGSASPKNCGSSRDVVVWYHEPGLPDSAQVLGGYNLATCESTLQSLKSTSPTTSGYCTEAAWARDNPGYNADASPAKRPVKVQVAVGPAC